MSGQQIGTVVGYAIGFYFGGPVGGQIGGAIGGMIGGAVDPDVIKAPGIGDAQKQTASAGIPRPVVYGHPAPFAGNIIDGEHKARKIIVKQRQGKGGGPIVKSERFLLTTAIRICEGPIGGVLRIWRNGEVVYDVRTIEDIPAYSGGSLSDRIAAVAAARAKSASFASRVRIYLGEEDQLPDSALEAIHGVGNTPYYRGTAYIVIEDDDVTDTRGSAAQYQFEVTSCGIAGTSANTARNEWLATFATEGTNTMARSPDGLDWSDPDFSPGGTTSVNPAYLSRNELEVLKTTIDGLHRFSDDGGGTWVACTGLTLSAAGGRAVYLGGFWHVQDTSNNVQRSSDGVAFSSVATAPSANAIAAVGSRLVAVYGVGDGWVYHSDDFGGTWTRVDDLPIAWGPPGGLAITASSTTLGLVAFESGDFGGSGTPDYRAHILSSTTQGDSWTEETNPFPDRIDPVSGSTNLIVHHDATLGLWVAVFSDRIAFGSSLTTLELSAHVLPEVAFGIDSDGTKFLVSGAAGMMEWSADGEVWTAVASGVSTEIWDVLALSVTDVGTEIPDAPGWFVHDDGSISGPTTDTVSACVTYLQEVAEDIASRCNVPADRFNVTALGGIEIPGLLVANQATGADCLRPTQQMYYYDLPEVDGQIVSVLRGGPIAATVTDDDMLGSGDDDETTRPQQIEYPAKVSLVTQDPAAEYSPIPQTSRRTSPNVTGLSEVVISSPIPLGADEAKQRADIIHKVMFCVAEGRREFALPEEFSRLVASDCIAYDSKRWLIEQKDSIEGEHRFKCVYDRASAYTSSATGDSAIAPTLPTNGLKGPTVFIAMNLPQLRTQDSTPGMYVAAYGLLPGWPGADLQLSVDEGVTFQSVLLMTAAATMGVLTDDITSSGTPLSVVVNEELESVTVDQLVARANAFALVGNQIEIGQFQTATLTAVDNRNYYDLTDLTRGQLETVAASHVVGESFVLLDSAVYFLPIDAIHAGKTLIFRAATLGTASENNATFSIVYEPPTYILDGGGA